MTTSPVDTSTAERYDNDTLRPGTGSIVTVIIPATDPAKVTRPDVGARTPAPTSAL
ncbi:MAG TPA: hypothetical protein VFT85_03935 [Acidimicrobiia bacterium]|nr:hypothetical protein [Acidimicrobiia bacterium]